MNYGVDKKFKVPIVLSINKKNKKGCYYLPAHYIYSNEPILLIKVNICSTNN